MSIPFSGTIGRTGSLMASIAKEIRAMNFKPVKKITVQFDPFHEKVRETRNFVYYISAPKLAMTNPTCLLKTQVVCDRSDPTVTCDLLSGEKIVFKTVNLDSLDILKLFNKYISSTVELPQKEVRLTVKEKKKLTKLENKRKRREEMINKRKSLKRI